MLQCTQKGNQRLIYFALHDCRPLCYDSVWHMLVTCHHHGMAMLYFGEYNLLPEHIIKKPVLHSEYAATAINASPVKLRRLPMVLAALPR